tara:strand:- start:304 stop:723 length:420 start_codon:yes stop_codon:yes gene_type:complete
MKSKRGEIGEVIGLEETIILILTVAFFFIVLTFANNAGSRAFIYEETYAKQIVSIIDNGKPGLNLLIDVGEGIAVGRENGLNGFFNVNNKDSRIEVRLSDGGYSYQYFSDYEVDLSLEGNFLVVKLSEKINGDEDGEES